MKRQPHQGIFMAIEGIDGAGKTRAIRQLTEIVETSDGIPPVVVREPGGTPFGEALRQSLAEHRESLSPVTQALAFNASRCELVTRVIRPALRSGLTVITDRWTPSTRVYQRRCPEHVLDSIIEAAAGELVEADLTLLFTRDPADAVASKIDEYGEENRQRVTERMRATQDAYIDLMNRAKPGRWIRCPFTDMDTRHRELAEVYRSLTERRDRKAGS